MDPFSEVTAIVNMLADYVRLLAKDPEARKGSAQEKALQIVRQALEPKYAHLLSDFEKDPDTYGDVVTKHLLRRTSQDKGVADELGDLLYQFHRDESAFQKVVIVKQDVSGTASGSVIGSDASVVRGDAGPIGNR